jgi:hypothetical protein
MMYVSVCMCIFVLGVHTCVILSVKIVGLRGIVKERVLVYKL